MFSSFQFRVSVENVREIKVSLQLIANRCHLAIVQTIFMNWFTVSIFFEE